MAACHVSAKGVPALVLIRVLTPQTDLVRLPKVHEINHRHFCFEMMNGDGGRGDGSEGGLTKIAVSKPGGGEERSTHSFQQQPYPIGTW